MLKKIVDIYKNNMSEDKEITQIISTIKELVLKNINNTQELQN